MSENVKIFQKKNDTFATYLFSSLRRLNNNFFLNYKPASLAGFFYFPSKRVLQGRRISYRDNVHIVLTRVAELVEATYVGTRPWHVLTILGLGHT